MISMEGTDRTALILDLHQRLCTRFNNVGITLQAYLYRTPDDLAAALYCSGRIRLVKGAYGASDHVAMPRGVDVDTAYRHLMERLLQSGHPYSIATHDSFLFDHAHRFIHEQGIKPGHIEFEMLKGVTPERLQGMRERGYRTRVYVPYGQEWHLYLCNRLAEYPLNLYQVIVDAVQSGSGP